MINEVNLIFYSGFFWLVAALITGALWYTFSLINIWSVVVLESLFFQELSRFAFWYLNEIASKTELMKTKGDIPKIKEDLSIGVGIATAHGVIMYGSILWEARGVGSYYLDSCPYLPLFFTSGIISSIISILDVCWTIIAFDGYRTRSIPKIGFVISAHFISSFLVYIILISYLNV